MSEWVTTGALHTIFHKFKSQTCFISSSIIPSSTIPSSIIPSSTTPSSIVPSIHDHHVSERREPRHRTRSSFLWIRSTRTGRKCYGLVAVLVVLTLWSTRPRHAALHGLSASRLSNWAATVAYLRTAVWWKLPSISWRVLRGCLAVWCAVLWKWVA